MDFNEAEDKVHELSERGTTVWYGKQLDKSLAVRGVIEVGQVEMILSQLREQYENEDKDSSDKLMQRLRHNAVVANKLKQTENEQIHKAAKEIGTKELASYLDKDNEVPFNTLKDMEETRLKYDIIGKLGYRWNNLYQMYLIPDGLSLPALRDDEALALAERILKVFVEKDKDWMKTMGIEED